MNDSMHWRALALGGAALLLMAPHGARAQCIEADVSACHADGAREAEAGNHGGALELWSRGCEQGQADSCAAIVSTLAAHPEARSSVPRLWQLLLRRCEQEDDAMCGQLGRDVFDDLDRLRRNARVRRAVDAACDRNVGAACAGRGAVTETRRRRRWRAGRTADFTHACELGDGRGCRRSGELLAPSDPRGALERFTAGCGYDDAISCGFQGRAIASGDAGAAAPLLGRACEAGDADSCVALGRLHEQGGFPGASDEAAQRAYGTACQGSDHPEACGRLGARMHARGEHAAAEPLLRTACRGRWSRGCVALGDVLTARNDARGARRFYRQARAALSRQCRRGNGEACVAVSELYRLGHGMRPNPRQATRWHNRACAAGAGDRARCLEGGLRLARPGNRRRAEPVLAPLCESGEAQACAALAPLLPPRRREPLYRRACQLGHAAACERLPGGRPETAVAAATRVESASPETEAAQSARRAADQQVAEAQRQAAQSDAARQAAERTAEREAEGRRLAEGRAAEAVRRAEAQAAEARREAAARDAARQAAAQAAAATAAQRAADAQRIAEAREAALRRQRQEAVAREAAAQRLAREAATARQAAEARAAEEATARQHAEEVATRQRLAAERATARVQATREQAAAREAAQRQAAQEAAQREAAQRQAAEEAAAREATARREAAERADAERREALERARREATARRQAEQAAAREATARRRAEQAAAREATARQRAERRLAQQQRRAEALAARAAEAQRQAEERQQALQRAVEEAQAREAEAERERAAREAEREALADRQRAERQEAARDQAEATATREAEARQAQDERAAVERIAAACDAGDVDRCTEAAARYRDGDGTEANPGRAAHYFNIACTGGAESAGCSGLADVCRQGTSEACAALAEACQAGVADACSEFPEASDAGAALHADASSNDADCDDCGYSDDVAEEPDTEPTRQATFRLAVLGGATNFGRTDTSLFRPNVAAIGRIDSLGPRIEVRAGIRLSRAFALDLTVGGTRQDLTRWLECAPGATQCAARAPLAYTIDAGLLLSAHTSPRRLGGNFDFHMGLGVRPYARVLFDDERGVSDLTATVAVAELGMSLFLADLVSLDLVVQDELWIPWRYCGHGATGAPYCLSAGALDYEFSWTALAGVTFHVD